MLNYQPTLVVRPELAKSVLRLADREAEYFERDDLSTAREDQIVYAQVARALRSFAAHVRAGKPVDLSSRVEMTSLGDWLIGSGVQYEFEQMQSCDGRKWDWRYLSDLAALAADIEAATV